LKIQFFSIHSNYRLLNKTILKNWINDIIVSYKKNPSTISIIICSDSYLININKKHLNHNFYTDIITFDYSVQNNISGDLFISIDRVKENALKFQVSLKLELYRVISHGILHLLGFNDKSKNDKSLMTHNEDLCLKMLEENYGIKI